MDAIFRRRKRVMENDPRFIKNGGMVLEKLIGFCNGKCNPIRNFSADELKRATNNYEMDNVFSAGGFFKMYKGFWQDRPILVKTYNETSEGHSMGINEIPFASQMSVHKNVLKLLGCCLESEIPILVFESATSGTLSDHLYHPPRFQPLLWKHRLKIAVDVAHAVAYLHNAFHKPVVHRKIKPKSILLDENFVAKLTDFSLSVSIPDGESHIEDELTGTFGYLAPEYVSTGCFNEKHDVYGFGVCLLSLLTGRYSVVHNYNDTDDRFCLSLGDYVKTYQNNSRLNETVDPAIVGEGSWPGKDEELQSFAEIALRCVSEAEENRPTMIDVAKQLKLIFNSTSCPTLDL